MTKDFSNNKILVKSLQSGEEAAYVYLLDAYHKRLCVYANSLIRDHDNAEDIVQNVFFKVWRKRKKLKVEHSIKSYLYKATYNEFIDQYRKNQAVFLLEKKYMDALDLVVKETDENYLEQFIKVIKQEIQLLPPKCKQVFTLSKFEGLTYIEISEHLNISIKTVEALMTRSFSTLRKKMSSKSDLFLFFALKNNHLNSNHFSL